MKVTQYGYRSARIENVIIVLPRELLGSLEKDLAFRAKSEMDNHTVYVVETPDFCEIGDIEIEGVDWDIPELCIWFSDFKVRIGTGLIEERW
jgi:hypothetical protein